MSTPPSERTQSSTKSRAPTPSAQDAPSVPAQGGTVPQVGPSPAALATGPAIQVPGYEIQGELGRGGMGVVYLAKNVLMNRPEVLKVANRALLDKQPGAAERFLREIRAAAKLSHENVVKAYSALQVGDLLVFAMEYIEGEDLSKLVQRQGPLLVAHACHYICQAAMGLQHAHEQGMVHRDIKPHNLILSRQGDKHVVKVLDFGLVKAVREGETVTDLTGQGTPMGTPSYMAPEQALDAASADIRTDIYSLGCTLYFLLTGAPPFTGKSHFAVLQAHAFAKATPLSHMRVEIPAWLEMVVERMMAKDPALRYQKPIEAALALAPFLQAAAPAAAADKKRSKKMAAGFGITPREKPADTKEPPQADAPFDAAEAKRLQQAWADALGVPVVREVGLGGRVVMKLVLIPPGSFQMGSPDSDSDAEERPQHQVTITKPFYLGMYPVTQDEYARVTGLNNPSAFSKGGSFEKAVQGLDTVKFPVEQVSWDEAAAFCEALNRTDGKRPAGWKYALPTEAQWEHACRAGTQTVYFFGDDANQLGDYAWYGDNSRVRMHEVGTRKPNPWGLCDMSGNVWQWCADYYDGYGKEDVIDPQNLSTGNFRVCRGGSLTNSAVGCRSACRSRLAPGHRDYRLGLRVSFRQD